MILDDRDGVGYSVSVDLVMDPKKNIGTIGGIPAMLYYQVPNFIKKVTTKYLMTESEIQTYYGIVQGNSGVYTGSVISNISVSGSVIFIDGERYYGATITETTYPPLGTYNGEGSTVTKSLNVSVSQFSTHGHAISGGEHMGVKINRKKSINLSAPTMGMGLSSGSGTIVLNTNRSNYRYVNGQLWCDSTSEELSF
jgi:hypothetical protein